MLTELGRYYEYVLGLNGQFVWVISWFCEPFLRYFMGSSFLS